MSNKKLSFDTQVIHANDPEKWQGATLPPIFQNAAHSYESAYELSQVFAGEEQGHIYMRLTNPTNSFLEEKLAVLENGKKAVVTASGMAAISNSCMSLLRAKDEFISTNSLFMSTYLLFTKVFLKYDIKARLVDPCDLKAIEKSINHKTRFIYMETIANPKMDVPELDKIAEIAHDHDLPLIVDNTLASPYLCRPLELGADIVVHSTTKYLSGHGNALGGVIVDKGEFPWLAGGRFKDFKPYVDRNGSLAFLDKMWREHHINFGATQSPWHSYLTCLGLDTLSLRMKQHLLNASKIANQLKASPLVEWVNHPSIENHTCHETAKRIFRGQGYGAVLTFGLKDQKACFKFIDNLKLIKHLANLGDCRTLAIHPYSTQYVSFDDPTKAMLSIKPEMIRLSVGIEAASDIWADIRQALKKAAK